MPLSLIKAFSIYYDCSDTWCMGMRCSVCKLLTKIHRLFTIADQISKCKKMLKSVKKEPKACIGSIFQNVITVRLTCLDKLY